MAKKTKPKNFKDLHEVKKLWKTVPVRQWLSLFKELAPEHKWEQTGQTTIKGCCPYHDDNTPSFVLSFAKGWGKCFGSCEKFVGDLVALTAKLKQCSYSEALLFLHYHFDLSESLGKNAEKFAAYHQVQEMKKETAIAMNKVISEVIRDNPSHLNYLKPSIAYLVNGRQIPVDTLPSLPVGVYAKPEHLKKYISEDLHEIFEEYFNKKFRGTKYWGAITFHYNDSPGTITRFKLRFLNKQKTQEAEAKLDTDNWLNVLPQEEAHKFGSGGHNFTYIDDPYTTEIGIYGLHKYQRMLGHNDANAYVTEGEFDVLSIMSAQELYGRNDFMILGTAGKGNLDVGSLKEFGVRTVWLVPDHPAANGNEWAVAFLKEKNNFAAAGNLRPLMIKIFQWPKGAMHGMDLDEAVRNVGYDEICEFLFRERNAHFVNSTRWIINRCDEQILKVRKEEDEQIKCLNLDEDTGEYNRQITNIQDHTKSEVTRIITDWFYCVNDPNERLVFTQNYVETENVDITKEKNARLSAYNLNTHSGCVSAVQTSLKEFVNFAYFKKSGKSAPECAFLWSKKNKTDFALQPSQNAVYTQFSTHLNMEVIDWLDRILGDSSEYLMYTDENASEGFNIQKRWDNGWFILKRAIGKELNTLKNFEELKKVGQGIHFTNLPSGYEANGIMYVVNGNKAFKGRFSPETDMLEWEYIENIVDDNLIFLLSPSAEWSDIKDVSDLYAGSQVDLKKSYQDLLTILDGWYFENDDIMTQYLAAHIMSMPIMVATGTPNVLYITGDMESGKTSLIQGLMGGRDSGHAMTSALESAKFFSDSTPAAVYQNFDKTTIACICDEADYNEANPSEHDKRVNEIQRLILYPLSQGGAKVSRGGQDRSKKDEFDIRMPVVMAGTTIPEDPTLISRLVLLYMHKQPGKRDIIAYINSMFKESELIQLRRNLTTGLLPYLPKIIQRRNELNDIIPQTKGIDHVSQRFLYSLLTPLVIYEMADPENNDPIELYKAILEKNKQQLSMIHSTNKNNTIINACLYTEAIRITTEEGMINNVNARSLIMQGQINQLNNSECGIYYFSEKDWIIIVWRQAKYTVLKSTQYGKFDENTLKERVDKNAQVIPEIPQEQHKAIQIALGLADIKDSTGYSVLTADYLGITNLKENTELSQEDIAKGDESDVTGSYEFCM